LLIRALLSLAKQFKGSKDNLALLLVAVVNVDPRGTFTFQSQAETVTEPTAKMASRADVFNMINSKLVSL
jgi:hypothetical protein